MKGLRNFARILILFPALAVSCASFADSDAGETVTKRGNIDDDYYSAGGVVDIDAVVAGDVIVAGGELYIGHLIEGDVIAAGGTLKIRGEIKDDIRASGGDLNIDAIIGDDLAAAGGSITLSPGVTVGGDAWLAGGEVHIAGTILGNLKVTGGDIRLSGTVHGDVELEGGEIQILDSARIDGELTYKSPRQATTGADAVISGGITHQPVDWDYADRGYGLVFSITLMVAAVLFYLFFPHYTLVSVKRIGSDPWSSLGLGFIFVVATPLVAFILMLIVLGLWVGLSMLALYCVALLSGFLIACFFVAERGARLIKQDISSRGRRLISVIVVIFVLGLIQMIPFLGGLILFLLLLLGLGAGLIQLRYVYRPAESGS
ncbi:MAG: carbohydrate-binding domain-containing protein [Gammaproteobacteria bacterium]|nr:carbohydrate-binding domain-containing protein [Gammaproteobacteria bacterium]